MVKPMINYNEIDNPLPDEVMRQKDIDFENQLFKDHCYEQAKELCEQNGVCKDLIDAFQEWYHNHFVDKPEEMPNVISGEDVDLIKDWWKSEGEDFDDYDSPYSMTDPTPQYLYDDTGGEPPISAEERNRKAFEAKQESHPHRFGFRYH